MGASSKLNSPHGRKKNSAWLAKHITPRPSNPTPAKLAQYDQTRAILSARNTTIDWSDTPISSVREIQRLFEADIKRITGGEKPKYGVYVGAAGNKASLQMRMQKHLVGDYSTMVGASLPLPIT